MKPTVSLSDAYLKVDLHLSNAQKIIKVLAEVGRMNKWDIHKKTSLPYPRVSEAVTILKKNGWIEKVDEKKSKNKLPSMIYSLTFKGIIAYLSLKELERPVGIGIAGESEGEFVKRYLASRTKYFKRLKELQIFLKSTGKELDYQIFSQIDWLRDNFGILVLHEVIDLAKNQITNPPPFFEAIEKRQRVKERKLMQVIKTLKKAPSLQKMVRFRDDVKGNRETEEIDFLRDEQSRLELLRRAMEASVKNENEYWRKSFSYDFFERLSYLKKNTRDRNESLAKVARELLEARRKTLTPLDLIVEKLEGGD